MEVLFIKDFDGHKPGVEKVADGYAKFVIGKKVAVPATSQTISQFTNEQRQQQEKARHTKEKLESLKFRLDGQTFTLAVKVGKEGHTFGSVRKPDLLKVISEQMGFAKSGFVLDEKQLILLSHTKQLGEYKFQIKLASNIVANPTLKLINVEKNEEEK